MVANQKPVGAGFFLISVQMLMLMPLVPSAETSCASQYTNVYHSYKHVSLSLC